MKKQQGELFTVQPTRSSLPDEAVMSPVRHGKSPQSQPKSQMNTFHLYCKLYVPFLTQIKRFWGTVTFRKIHMLSPHFHFLELLNLKKTKTSPETNTSPKSPSEKV